MPHWSLPNFLASFLPSKPCSHPGSLGEPVSFRYSGELQRWVSFEEEEAAADGGDPNLQEASAYPPHIRTCAASGQRFPSTPEGQDPVSARCWTRGKGLRSRYVDVFSHNDLPSPEAAPLASPAAGPSPLMVPAVVPSPPTSNGGGPIHFFLPTSPVAMAATAAYTQTFPINGLTSESLHEQSVPISKCPPKPVVEGPFNFGHTGEAMSRQSS